MSQNGNNKGGKFHFNKDVKDFANMTMKKYKKDNKDFFESKKDLKKAYWTDLIDLIPAAIDFCVSYGHINKPEVQETKLEIYKKIQDPDFVKVLKKEIKHDNDIKNIRLLPIVIKEILMEADRANKEILAKDPGAKPYDMSDLQELSLMILKKRMKKLVKEGVSEGLAFDILSIIPCKEALQKSQFYRIHAFYDTLYEHAKGATIPFGEIVNIVFGDDFTSALIVFALLERKEKFSKLTDAQKSLYLDINSWCLNNMEKMSKTEVREIIETYIKGRKKDEAQGKDGTRRFVFSSLPANDYEKINKVVTAMIADNDSYKKYL